MADSTTKKRSFGWKCGRLMLPGNHLMRTTYGPGLLGSPYSTACSFVPAAFRTHLMSAGVVKSTAVRSMSVPWPEGTATVTARAARTRIRIARDMSPPSRLTPRQRSVLEELIELLIEEVWGFLHRIVGARQHAELVDVRAVVGPGLAGVELALRVALFRP